MKVTALTAQLRDNNRINVSIDGKYRFSLDISQIIDLGIKLGGEYDEDRVKEFEQESQFGKLYARTLEFALKRPHSQRELNDYLYKKTLSKKIKSSKTGKLIEIPGASRSIVDRVREKILEKGYVDDRKFTEYWVENRRLRTGASARKLEAELRSKGVDTSIIQVALSSSGRNDTAELRKVIAKKSKLYSDPQKLKAYLLRSGFNYDDIVTAIDEVIVD